MITIKQLILKLRGGGVIISSDNCTLCEISSSMANDNMWVDEDGFGYVYKKHERLWGVYSEDEVLISCHHTEQGAKNNEAKCYKDKTKSGDFYVDWVTIHP